MAVFKVKSPQHPSDWPRHRLTCDTPLGFMIKGVDPFRHELSSRRRHRSVSVAPCIKLVNRRFTALPLPPFPFPFSSWLRLFPRWFACLVCSFPFALVLAHVLGFALLALLLLASFHWRLFLFWLLHSCLSPWLCLCFSVVFSFSFLSLLFCAPWPPPGDCPFPRIVFAIACVIFSPSTSSDSSCVSVTRPRSVNAFVTDVWTRFCCRSTLTSTNVWFDFKPMSGLGFLVVALPTPV